VALLEGCCGAEDESNARLSPVQLPACAWVTRRVALPWNRVIFPRSSERLIAAKGPSLLKNPCLSVGNTLAVPFHMLLGILKRLKIGH